MYTAGILLYMKPLYSTFKRIAFWQHACILHDVIFYLCLTTVSTKRYNTGKYTRLAIGIYLCTVGGWIKYR